MTFIEYLERNKHKKIFVDKCSGNNGDLLIWLGMQEVLNKTSVNIVESPDLAEVIIINGGGMFIDSYSQGIDKVSYYTDKYANIELCIAPNSFYFKKINFSSVLKLRKSPMLIFSRERFSEMYIKGIVADIELVTSFIDKDLAFHLEGSDLIKKIKEDYPHPIKGSVLVVDRMDVEHPEVKQDAQKLRKLYSKFVPDRIKSIIRLIRLEKREKYGTEFTRTSKELIVKNDEGYVFSTVETSDISRVDICTFELFVKKIAEAEYVFTNRLHVGVLAHLLSRNTYMREGSYYKMTGIYDLSMAGKNTTKILNRHR